MKNRQQRGAQPGNHNAVKHGYYSSVFKEAERRLLEQIPLTDLSAEIQLIRVTSKRFLQALTASKDHLDFDTQLDRPPCRQPRARSPSPLCSAPTHSPRPSTVTPPRLSVDLDDLPPRRRCHAVDLDGRFIEHLPKFRVLRHFNDSPSADEIQRASPMLIPRGISEGRPSRIRAAGGPGGGYKSALDRLPPEEDAAWPFSGQAAHGVRADGGPPIPPFVSIRTSKRLQGHAQRKTGSSLCGPCRASNRGDPLPSSSMRPGRAAHAVPAGRARGFGDYPGARAYIYTFHK